MNVTINQNNQITESVALSIINKICELADIKNVGGSVDLTGNIKVSAIYANQLEKINSAFDPDKFIVNYDNLYIYFEDPDVESILKIALDKTEDEGITPTEAALITSANIFANNSNIDSFDEFRYFAYLNQNGTSFDGCSSLKSIDLSKVVKTLQYEFRNCTSLAGDISMPNLRELGVSTFRGSYISSVSNLGSIVSIPDSCFYGCDMLLSVNLPSTTTLIGTSAFTGSMMPMLLTINLKNVTHVNNNAFNNVSTLQISASDLSNLVSVGNNSFNGCTGILGELNLPQLVSLGTFAFSGCGITSISSLGSVDTISNSCFKNCKNLTSVNMPSTITTINGSAFEGTSLLVLNVDLSNIQTLGERAFAYSSITGTVDLTNLKTIYRWPFFRTKITKVILPASTANNITYTESNQHYNSIDNLFAAMPELTEIITDVKEWRIPFKVTGCSNLTPFVIYLPLLTTAPVGALGGDWIIDLHWPAIQYWSLIYYPNITDLMNTKYGYSSENSNSGVIGGGNGEIVLDILYLRNLTDIDNAAFDKIRGSVVINSTEVPNLWSHTRDKDDRTAARGFLTGLGGWRHLSIYVPDSALSDYQAAWDTFVLSWYPFDIYGISTLNNGIIYATEADWTAAGKPAGLIAEYLGLDSTELAAFVSANNLTYYTPNT